MKAKVFTVYKIEVNNVIKYIGYTNNLKRREKEHIRAIYNIKNIAYNKEFYKYYREVYNDKESGCNVLKLGIIKEFKSKIDAKRYEAFLILNDYFSNKVLIQKVPNISDR